MIHILHNKLLVLLNNTCWKWHPQWIADRLHLQSIACGSHTERWLAWPVWHDPEICTARMQGTS